MAAEYTAEYVDDPVLCPECGKEARKGTGVERPIVPLDDLMKNALSRSGGVTRADESLGKAYCENPKCPVHYDFITWLFQKRT